MNITGKGGFKKGQSGHLEGRPKGTISIIAALNKRLAKFPPGKKRRKYVEYVVDVILHLILVLKNVEMIKLILEYTDGKPLTHSGNVDNFKEIFNTIAKVLQEEPSSTSK